MCGIQVEFGSHDRDNPGDAVKKGVHDVLRFCFDTANLYLRTFIGTDFYIFS
jgi:hypothetical protein